MAGPKAEEDSVENARHPPVAFIVFGDVLVSADFDPSEWVLVPRVIHALSDRRKRGWSKDVSREFGERYGYGRRDEWTTTLAKMLAGYTDSVYLERAATFVRVAHDPGRAPVVEGVTVMRISDLASLEEFDDLFDEPETNLLRRRDPEKRRITLRSGREASIITRYLAHQDGSDPYVLVSLFCLPTVWVEAVISRDEQHRQAIDNASYIANAVTLTQQTTPADGA